MKPLQYKMNNKRLLNLGILGTILAVVGSVILVVDPLKRIVDYTLSMQNGSYLFKIWQKPNIDVFINVYIFNITNSEAFLSGREKLRLEEVGPYVYQEFLQNTEAVFNENKTLSYRPRRTVLFRPDLSVGDPNKTTILVPNIALLGISSAVTRYSAFMEAGIASIALVTRAEPILNLTVYDYLWGYDDPVVKMASTFLPSIITFSKLGLLDRMFDDGDNIVTMNLNKTQERNEFENNLNNNTNNTTNLPSKLYSIELWNGSPGLEHWGYKPTPENKANPTKNKCNFLQGAYEGLVFPPGITPASTFNLYRKAFCRLLPIEYSHAGITEEGLEGYWFKFKDNLFDMEFKDNNCYCKKYEKCLLKGLSDLTPCYYNIPAAVSYPHFYQGDPSLLENIDGLKPDAEKHGAEIVIQPRLGIPMKVNTRIQTNLVIGKTKFNPDIKKFNNLVVPLLWVDMSVKGLPKDILMLLQLLFTYAPIIQTGVIYIGLILGISMVAVMFLLMARSSRNASLSQNVNIRYTAIRIFPILRRDISNLK